MTSRLSVFFPVRSFYPSQVGGPSNTVYWHTCALTNNGVEVRVVATTWGIKEGDVQENVWVEDECGRVFYGKGTASTPMVIIKALGQIKKCHIVHLNSLFHGLSFMSFFYSRLFYPKKRIVWSVRGELSPKALRFGNRKKNLLLFLYKRFNKKALFHSTSPEESFDIRRKFPYAEIVEIPNLLLPAERLSLEPKKQFLFMGRIHPIKALDKLIKGISLSRLFIARGYKLLIVGTHSRKNQSYIVRLHHLIKELNLTGHVEFKGHVVGKSKEIIYAESFSLILPSESENFGNVVVEAMNHGTPAIASKGTPWSILEEHKCGYHIENTPEEIALAIDKMINLDENSYLRMRENAVKLVDSHFNIGTRIKVWIDLYQSLLEK